MATISGPSFSAELLFCLWIRSTLIVVPSPGWARGSVSSISLGRRTGDCPGGGASSARDSGGASLLRRDDLSAAISFILCISPTLISVPSPGREVVSVRVISFGLSLNRRTGGFSSSGMGGRRPARHVSPESATGSLPAHRGQEPAQRVSRQLAGRRAQVVLERVRRPWQRDQEVGRPRV